MELRERGKQRRKQRIIDAAGQILQQSGLEALTTAKLARRAEVSVATLYNLIGSIDHILDLLIAELSDGFEQTLAQSAVATDPAERLSQYIDATYDFCAVDSAKRQAILRAIIQSNVNAGMSHATFLTAGAHQHALLSIVRDMQREKLLQSSIDPSVFSEQLQVTLVVLTQNWAANVISLERSRLNCHYHISLLLKACASSRYNRLLEQRIGELQAAIKLQIKRDKRAKQKAS